ncbi:glycosyltransferase family 4 protein [Roseivirga pacifica]|uniref:glycosyltransferase family 4 protein n=1 Tax=Roseivirga pacifica TaxID=1267423 RepID=UPI003BA97D2B
MATKILYIHQYFKTPQEGGAIRSYYLSRGLVEKGFEVELITSHNDSHYTVKQIDGIKVHYLPVKYANEMGFVQRINSFLKFVRQAKQLAAKIEGIDKAYISSTPLTVGLIGLWLKKKRNIPYIFEVRDLWPKAPIQIGAIKGALLKRYLYRMEAKIYRGAEKIVALSPGMRDWIKEVVADKEVYMIPNMADCQFFKKEIKDPKLIEFYHAETPFVVTYLGSIGQTNHLEFLLDIAEKSLQKGLNINFKIVGQGSRLSAIKLQAYLKKLNNVEFIGHQDKEGVRRILNITDATYVCFNNLPVLATNSPNKLFDSLASGKLTIVNTPGWTKDLVEKYKCGFYADPLNPDDFLEQISVFMSEKDKLEAYKTNARSIAEKLYSKRLQIEKLAKVLNNEQHFRASEDEVYILTA